jgi:hypothetical protein
MKKRRDDAGDTTGGGEAMRSRMLRLGLSLILGVGWWTNRLPAQEAPAALPQAPAHVHR